jgi:hypothetical protein
MIKKIISITSVLFIALISVYAVKGSGNLSQEERPVSSFHTVYFNCQGNLNITQGNKTLLKVKADDNVISSIKTGIKRGELTISLKGIVTDATIEIEIVMDNINKLEVTGNGIITINGGIQTDNLELRVNGGGGISSKVTSKFLFTKLFGNGYMDIAGDTDSHETEISAGGEVRAVDLNTKKTKCTITGVGKTKINVSDDLEIKVGGLGGNGIIEFRGKPKLKIDVFGTASIISLEQ